MRILMKKTMPGSIDGIKVNVFKKDCEYVVGTDITDYLADVFLNFKTPVAVIIGSGVPTYVQDIEQPPETNDSYNAPENDVTEVNEKVIKKMTINEMTALIETNDKLTQIDPDDFKLKSDLAKAIIKALEN